MWKNTRKRQSSGQAEQRASTPADAPELEIYSDVEEQQNKPIRSRELRRLFGHVFHYKLIVCAGLLLVLLATAAGLLEPRIFGLAIDDAIVPRRVDTLKRYATFFLLIECIRVSATIGHSYVFTLLGQKIMQDLRMAIFSHMQRLPVSVFDRNPAGKLVTRVTNDISALAEMFSAGFVSIIVNALSVLGILAWLFVLDARLALTSMLVLPLLAGTAVYFSGKLRVAYREARSRLSSLNAFLAENFLGMKVVQLFNRQPYHLKRFGRVNDAYSDAQVGTIHVFAFFQPTITLVTGIAMALVIWSGGTMVSQGSLKIGVLVAFFAYVLALFQPIREMADKWNIFLSGMASAERIFSILDWPTELDEESARANRVASSAVSGAIRGHIVFDKVWFAYQGDHWVLKDFSLDLKPGTRLGVVGHTGAGKTTLISLLMRFYEPQRGRILLDGKDLREYDKRVLRSAIGIVQQDVFLFSGTVRDNVTLLREFPQVVGPEVPERLGRLDTRENWDPLETSLGLLPAALRPELELQERGVNLSMGEKQMIAFARALYRQPRIWILDEATANVDSESERALGATLARHSRGHTAILIAHRLATVRTSDLIIVLHKGELIESGRHEELMELEGLYARLYRLQQAEAEAVIAAQSAPQNPPS